MAELTLAERLRTAHVTRWQIVRTARQQTLAEHLYLVRTWVQAFAVAAGFGEYDTQLAEKWALDHDLPEVITGDLATPVKAMMRAAVPQSDPIRTIELSLSESYAALYHLVKVNSPWVRDLVKMADLVEAVAFLEIEGMGPHAFNIRRNLWQCFHDLVESAQAKYPDFNWAEVYNVARKQTGA